MIVFGLTGSVAMGKSHVAAIFRSLHIPVFDADKAVHRLLTEGGAAVPKVAALFPQALEGRAINRKTLAGQVFGNKQALSSLEKILHPLVREEEKRFLKNARLRNFPLVVLEIPLLFETGAERLCDKVMVVTASFFLQKQRVLKRPAMTEQKLRAILKRQTHDHSKRSRADYLIYSGMGKAFIYRQVKAALEHASI